MKKFWLLIISLCVSLSAHSMCLTMIVDIDNANRPVDFYNGDKLGRKLIASYNPLLMQRQFTNRVVCVIDKPYYAFIGQEIYVTKNDYNNQDKLVFLKFPDDFEFLRIDKKIVMETKDSRGEIDARS